MELDKSLMVNKPFVLLLDVKILCLFFCVNRKCYVVLYCISSFQTLSKLFMKLYIL